MLLALQSCFPHWDALYWFFGVGRKAILSTIFLIIKVHPWKKTNSDTHNNPFSFGYGHHNHVLLIGIHNIDALDLEEMLFFPPFSFQLKFTYEKRQTWILIIISIFSIIGITIMFSTLGYTMLKLWIYKKSFCFHFFPSNWYSPMKRDKTW